jgi:hypothetical protein
MPDSCIGVATLAKCSLQQLQSICSGRSFSAGSAGHSVGVEAESGRPSLASASSTSASDAAMQPRTAAEAESAGETGPGALPAGGTMPPPPGGSSGVVVADLAAKLELLEDAGVPRDGAVQRYAPFLCSPTHHIAVRLAFLAARGKLRRPPRLWQVGLGAASRGGTGPCALPPSSLQRSPFVSRQRAQERLPHALPPMHPPFRPSAPATRSCAASTGSGWKTWQPSGSSTWPPPPGAPFASGTAWTRRSRRGGPDALTAATAAAEECVTSVLHQDCASAYWLSQLMKELRYAR